MCPLFGHEERNAADQLIKLALQEDLGIKGDITSQAVIPADFEGKADIVVRRKGVISGIPIIRQVLDALDRTVVIDLHTNDGSEVNRQDAVATLQGNLRSILAAERTLLNFLQRLSGIASLTQQYVSRVKHTRCQILDTRKTTPGWRYLEKYAVRCGGGTNHRMGLFDRVMIKDNHLAALREHGSPILTAIKLAQQIAEKPLVEVEVESIEQLRLILPARPDIVLLDNMKPALLREAVMLRNQLNSSTRLEASGGVTLDNLTEIAETGVEFVSIGALTHSAIALDIALDYREQ